MDMYYTVTTLVLDLLSPFLFLVNFLVCVLGSTLVKQYCLCVTLSFVDSSGPHMLCTWHAESQWDGAWFEASHGPTHVMILTNFQVKCTEAQIREDTDTLEATGTSTSAAGQSSSDGDS